MDYKIQIITKNVNFGGDIENHKISSFGDFDSFDAYDFNIIDLNHSEVMEFDESKREFSFEEDFRTINNNIGNMKTDNKIIFLSPQNIRTRLLKSDWASSDVKIVIKDKTKLLSLLISYFNLFDIDLVFDKDKTKIQGNFLFSDFCILEKGENDVITKNIHDKITTVRNNNKYFTVLQFDTTKDLIDYLIEINLINEQIQAPAWFNEIKLYDDEEQFHIINVENEKIENSKIKINQSKEILEKNNHYKSILYSNSDELVNVVFEILEEILDCDLSCFADERKEDFLIEFDDNKIIIGEIKGVSSNVRYDPIDQLERHYHTYLEEHAIESEMENIKQLLIINYERKKKPSERTEIHNNQLKIAERNGCLIIDLNRKIGNNQLKEYIFNNSGLFKLEKLL